MWMHFINSPRLLRHGDTGKPGRISLLNKVVFIFETVYIIKVIRIRELVEDSFWTKLQEFLWWFGYKLPLFPIEVGKEMAPLIKEFIVKLIFYFNFKLEDEIALLPSIS